MRLSQYKNPKVRREFLENELGIKLPFIQKALIEDEKNIKEVGKVFILKLKCDACGINTQEVEIEGNKKPKVEFKVKNQNDLKKQIIKSSSAIIKIPELKISIKPTENSVGDITTVQEFIDNLIKYIQETNEISSNEYKKSEKLLDELDAAKENNGNITLIIEDKEGNSAIV